MPSDLVAEAIKLIQEEGKPVIISQGDLAASGGYWISMYGDEIITTPLTITGSIGVISAWVWDKEMHEKVGLTVDGVDRGKHYSMNQSYRYPLIGIRLPARDLTDKEFARNKEDILDMYDDFVEAVAEGRNMSTDEIYPIAGGHVWMGGDAVENGLADSIGGLQTAINRAADLAGIGDRFQLTEYPPRPLFKMPSIGAPFGMLGSINISPALYISDQTGNREDPAIAWLKLMAESQGSGQIMMMPVTLPDGWMFTE
ncbi:S49 family peptidase [bacterium]|nr:S49 family peptidase [bacterium]